MDHEINSLSTNSVTADIIDDTVDWEDVQEGEVIPIPIRPGLSTNSSPGSGSEFEPFREQVSQPATMGAMNGNSTSSAASDRWHERRRTSSLPVSSLEPNFYQIGVRMADNQWAMNYQEAAIYLEEGSNNDQFSTHPQRKESLPAYVLAHTSWFYLLDLGAALLLLALAVAEPPALDTFHVPIAVHASLELGALTILIFDLILKLRWLGFKTIFTHHRTSLKALTLAVMVVEAVVVLVRQSSHFRVTRALRPIFLMDNRYCRGVRRFVREVLQSLPPILDMLLLLLFFIFTFALLGHFLFGMNTDDPYFSTFEMSFVNLFVLLTTANYPDVMMPAYSRSRWAVFFFVTYLVTVLYLFMNLLLAVVYDAFTTLEKEKFRKLVVHKRKACHFAFNLLVSKTNTDGVIFRHFYGMMTQYAPRKPLRDIYLSFRALNKSHTGIISREEFCRFYEVSSLKWKAVSNDFQQKWVLFEKGGMAAQRFLYSQYSEIIFNAVVIVNTLVVLVRWYHGSNLASWDSFIFATWFVFEMVLKITTWGVQRVFTSGWHTFDLAATILFVFSIIIATLIPQWNEVMAFVRPLRLLRLFKVKKRYRDVFGTVFILIPPMSSAAVVILLSYYSYSVIGMELFASAPLRNCCQNTSFESYFEDVPNGTPGANRYYLNSFENLFSSVVTLFELTVVNNWYVIMEGHVLVTSRYSRIYFMSFYLVTMVLLTIIVAFILDAFLFRIQYKRAMNKSSESKMLRTEVTMSAEEVDFCYKHDAATAPSRLKLLQEHGEELATKGAITFVGNRRRTKEILFKRMFRTEIPDWLKETEPVMQIRH